MSHLLGVTHLTEWTTAHTTCHQSKENQLPIQHHFQSACKWNLFLVDHVVCVVVICFELEQKLTSHKHFRNLTFIFRSGVF